MIKMLCQVPRKVGLGETDFFPRYQFGHGDLVRSLAQPMGFLKYVQAHRIPSPEIDAFALGRGWRAPLDGQSELWWESVDSMKSALGSAEGAEASAILESDEQAFTDTNNVSAFIAEEKVIFDFSDELSEHDAPVKMVVDVWRRPGMTMKEFTDRWHHAHGELVHKHAAAMGFSKYVQNHRDENSEFNFATSRGWLTPPDGVTEVWWPSEEAMRSALATNAAQESGTLLRIDEDEFVDATKTRAFLASEKIIFDFIDQ